MINVEMIDEVINAEIINVMSAIYRLMRIGVIV
ncbi:MAG: hypothetical protein K0S61_1346 [Anaerocolumna sp.]|nr:hypothetical protein [Anaerocolumna sp.]